MWTTSLCWISGSIDFLLLSSLFSPENEGSVGPSVKQKALLGLPSGAGEKMGEAERDKSTSSCDSGERQELSPFSGGIWCVCSRHQVLDWRPSP